MEAEDMKPADLCMKVCTGSVHTMPPGVSSDSKGSVSRISNSPRYEQQLTEKSC